MKKFYTVSLWNPRSAQGKTSLSVNIIDFFLGKGVYVYAISSDKYSHVNLLKRKNLIVKDSLNGVDTTCGVCVIDHPSSKLDFPNQSDCVMIPVKVDRKSDILFFIDLYQKFLSEKRHKNTVFIMNSIGNSTSNELKNLLDILESEFVYNLKKVESAMTECEQSSSSLFDKSFDQNRSVLNFRRSIEEILLASLERDRVKIEDLLNTKKEKKKSLKSTRRVLKAFRISEDRAMSFGKLAVEQKISNNKNEQDLADEAIDLLLKEYYSS